MWPHILYLSLWNKANKIISGCLFTNHTNELLLLSKPNAHNRSHCFRSCDMMEIPLNRGIRVKLDKVYKILTFKLKKL